MFCNFCGASLSDKAKFCTTCGNPVNRPQPAQPAADNASVPVMEAPAVPVQEAVPAPFQDMPAPVQEAVPAPVQETPASVQEAPAPVEAAPVNEVSEQPAPAEPVPEYTQPVQAEAPVQPTVPDNVQFSAQAPMQETPGVLPPDQNIFAGEAPNAAYSAPPVNGQPVYNAAPAGYEVPQGGQMPVPDAQYMQNAVQPDVYSNVAAAQPKKQVKKLNLAVTIVIAILFGIIAFALGIAAFTAGSVRMGIAEHSISETVGKVDIGNLTVGDLLSSPALQKTVDSNGIMLPDKKASKATVAQIVALNVKVNGKNFSEDQVNDIISELNISGELATVVEAYEEYLLTGKAGDQFEDGLCDEIRRIVKNGEKDVIKITNMRLTDNYEETLDKTLSDNEDLIEGILPENSLKKFSSVIGIAFSPVVLIVALVLAVGLLVLVGVISKRVTAALMTGGVVFTLTGAILCAISMIIYSPSMIPAISYSIVEDLLSPLLYTAFGNNFLFAGIICAGTGLLLIAAFIIIKVVGKARCKKAAQQ